MDHVHMTLKTKTKPKNCSIYLKIYIYLLNCVSIKKVKRIIPNNDDFIRVIKGGEEIHYISLYYRYFLIIIFKGFLSFSELHCVLRKLNHQTAILNIGPPNLVFPLKYN